MSITTAYLCDKYSNSDNFHIAEPLFRCFGAKETFSGKVTTIRCFEDNSIIKQALSENGLNRVLVIDGGGSQRCALIDANLAQTGFDNGWEGMIIYGCIRNTKTLARIPIGILALHTHPLLCLSKDSGERDVLITVAGVNFKKDYYVYADTDGIIVSGALLS